MLCQILLAKQSTNLMIFHFQPIVFFLIQFPESERVCGGGSLLGGKTRRRGGRCRCPPYFHIIFHIIFYNVSGLSRLLSLGTSASQPSLNVSQFLRQNPVIKNDVHRKTSLPVLATQSSHPGLFHRLCLISCLVARSS